jgi:predicted phosphodiesterase
MITLAVLADIHGNSTALQAVLDDLDSQGGADHTIVLGDLAVFGPDPVGVLTLLKDREPISHITGNTDRYLVEKRYPTGSGKQSWEAQVLASFPWTARQLGQEGLEFLAGLPRRQLLRFSQEHRVMAVHGSPRSDEENIHPDTPEEELERMLWGGSILQPTALCPYALTAKSGRVWTTGGECWQCWLAFRWVSKGQLCLGSLTG